MNRTKRILLSLTLVGAVAAAVGLGSAAFFSDTETSTNNVLEAGSIDLKLDNTSYYFDGEVHRMENMTWTLKDLEPGVEKFFDLADLKPGDWGEDTISLHVSSNPAWVCANIDLTGNDENTLVGPESKAGDTTEQVGELGDYLQFIFWADDGDNVWECTDNREEVANNPNFVEFKDGLFCERPLLSGVPSSLEEVSTTFPIADSSGNAVWDNPLDPQNDYYIGKYWCFGKMDYDPASYVPGDDKSPLNGQSGFTCDGGPSGWGNVAQTDFLTADISFEAVQARHNDDFVCNPAEADVVETNNWSQVDIDSKEWFAKAKVNEPNPDSDFELQVGVDDTNNTLFDSDDTVWTDNQQESFTLTYDGAGNATFEVAGRPTTTYAVGTDTYGRIGITLKAPGDATTSVSNLALDVAGLPTTSTSVTGGTKSLTISGVDLSSGFVLTGNFTFDWGTLTSNGENQKVQFSID